MVFPIHFPELSSNSQQAVSLAKTKKLGEFKQDKVIYSNYEAFYLIDTKKANPYYKEKRISQKKVLKLFLKKDKEFLINYLVYKDLRIKSYIPKTGLKFGAEFRVYSKPKNQKDSLTHLHAKYLTLIATSKQKINLREFISKNRVAHSTAKKLLITIVDSQQDITYYEVNWAKL
jgi:tRNA-intron endonuclease, archaea type